MISPSGRMRIKKILAAVMILAAAAAAGVLLWLNGSFLPGWVTWNETENELDLDADGTAETLILRRRRVYITQGSETLYSSPFLWRISDVFAQDLDHDGAKEIIMLVWKHGSYGPNRPFWVEHDTPAFSQHVFIFRFQKNRIASVWMSSDIGRKIREAFYDDQDLLHLVDVSGEETVWAWDSWGLVLADEPETAEAAVPEEPCRVSLLAVGDNIAHTSVVERAYDPEKGSFDFSDLYSEVAEKISAYDIAVVNQETILTADPDLRSGYPLFATPDTMGDALAGAGFDVVLAATNHSYDLGERGIEDTLAFWKEKHPEVTLAGIYGPEEEDQPAGKIIEKNGIRIAVFDLTEKTNGISLPKGYRGGVYSAEDLEKITDELALAEKQQDISICFLHGGEEYAAEPSEKQRQIADSLAEAGADLIICSHSHVLQPRETIRVKDHRCVVYWSLGNFMSNQMDERTVPGGAADIVIEKREGKKAVIASCGLVPLLSHFDGRSTKVYFLDDYTQELAAQHSINREKTVFTLEDLKTRVPESN